MDTRGIGAVLLKVAGLVLITMSVANLPGFFSPLSAGVDWSFGESAGAAAVILGPLAVLGVVFWLFPGAIVNKIVAEAPSSQASSFDPRPIELIALAILGIYLIARGAIDLIQVISFIVAMQVQNSEHAFISATIISRVAAIGAQVLIGIWLCVGAKSVAGLIARLRG